MSEAYDVVILGAGPAGLAAAVYTGRAMLSTLILEKGIPGGQVLLTDWVENFPGFPEGIVPRELVENFKKHAEKFGAKIETDEVQSLRKEGRNWLLVGGNKEFTARAVIIATGSVYRKLGLPNEEKLTGKGVSFCATCDGAFFKEKDVAVVGGGDNALTEALFLTKFCKKVTVIHRRDQFRGEKILHERAFANEKIDILWDTVVEEIHGKERLESLTLRNVKDNTTSSLPVEGLFVSVGMDPATDFVKGLVDLNKWRQIKVGPGMSTSQKGIYAAGDVTDACPRQIATAVGTGVSAALSVSEYLYRAT